MVQALRELKDPAPETLAGKVLAEAGLIDAYAEVAGPIGPLYIAWSATGVTLVERAGDARLEVGIGLESADDRVRSDLMQKGFSLAAFERAAAVIRDCGAALLAYVFLKPPGLDEAAARDDAMATARYLSSLSARLRDGAHPAFRVTFALQPAFVARGSALEAEWAAGRYQLLNLWTVLEVVLCAARLLPVQVGLWDEGLAQGRVPSGCDRCSGRLRDALRRFNESADLSLLENLPRCACAPAP